MKTDLRDLTFLIPVRLDSINRLENVGETVQYILSHFITNISVMEISSFNSGVLCKLLNNKVKYTFIEDKDPIFHRTKYRNLMANKVEISFISVWDSDVIVDKSQITDAMEKLRGGEFDFAYPYNGKFYDTSEIIRALYFKRKNIKVLHQNQRRMSLIYGQNHKGGAFIANTEKYKQTGMENEKFYGWGPEDYERYDRWINLGFRIYHAPGCMYHLSHPRDINGRFNSQRQMEITRSELAKTRKSSFKASTGG